MGRRDVLRGILILVPLSISALVMSLISSEVVSPDLRTTDDTSQRDTGLKAEPDFFELSTSGASVPLRIVAHLRNTSHQPIEILNVKSSCGCTVPDPLPTQPVGPGKTAELPIMVSPAEFGTTHITLTIATNSNSTPSIPVKITARGKTVHAPYVAFAPLQMRLAGNQPDATIEQEFTIQAIENRDAGPWIQAIKTRDPSVKCEIVGTPDDKTYLGEIIRRIYVIRVQGKLAGRNSIIAELEIATATPATRPVAPIWVSVLYEPAVRAVPSLLTVHEEAAVTVLHRDILLMTESTKEWIWRVASVDLPPGISIMKVPGGEDSSSQRFRVSMDHEFIEALGKSADHRVILRFSTGIEADPVVEVPVVLAR